MIRPIQRLPSVLLLLERLLKYTPATQPDYQQLSNAMAKLREVAKKLNEERGKTEKHLSLFSIVNSIDNCPVGASLGPLLIRGIRLLLARTTCCSSWLSAKVQSDRAVARTNRQTNASHSLSVLRLHRSKFVRKESPFWSLTLMSFRSRNYAWTHGKHPVWNRASPTNTSHWFNSVISGVCLTSLRHPVMVGDRDREMERFIITDGCLFQRMNSSGCCVLSMVKLGNWSFVSRRTTTCLLHVPIWPIRWHR